MSETSVGGSPTVSSTSTRVTSPACGIPAAPILAAVDVILMIIMFGVFLKSNNIINRIFVTCFMPKFTFNSNNDISHPILPDGYNFAER